MCGRYTSTKKLLPLAAMEKILKESGAERVSNSAKLALKDALEEIGESIALDAVKLAQHAGRKTIKKSDIRLASK